MFKIIKTLYLNAFTFLDNLDARCAFKILLNKSITA